MYKTAVRFYMNETNGPVVDVHLSFQITLKITYLFMSHRNERKSKNLKQDTLKKVSFVKAPSVVFVSTRVLPFARR